MEHSLERPESQAAQTPEPAGVRRRLTGARAAKYARIGLAFGLIGLLLFVVDGVSAAKLLFSADLGWLGAAFGMLTLQTWVSALRWRITADRLGHGFSFPVALREYYLAQFLNQTLPSGMVGDAGRAFRTRGKVGLWTSSQAVALERLSGQAALVGVLLLTLSISTLVPGGIAWPGWVAQTALMLAAAAALLPLVTVAARRLPGALGRIFDDMVAATTQAMLTRDIWRIQLILSLATAACSVLAFVFCARATGTILSPTASMTIVPLILLTMLIPVSVSGWGLRESAAVALFPLTATTGAAGLAASVAFGLTFLAVTLPGAIPLLSLRRDMAPLAHLRRPEMLKRSERREP